jgi:hypothetical protein
MSKLARIAVFVTLMSLTTAHAMADHWLACGDAYQDRYQVREDPFALVPGVSWDAWRIPLHEGWSSTDRSRAGWFDAQTATDAATLAPLDSPYHPEAEPSRIYAPSLPATQEQEAAYAAAAALYRRHDWPSAIVAFDRIVEQNSPYSAAAAYSAARSALYHGDFTDGFRRIEHLTANPAMREMHQAAYNLVGTLANQTGASPLIAAHLVAISHLLTAPPEMRCRYTELRNLAAEASDDLLHIHSIGYPDTHYYSIDPWSRHTRGVFARLAQTHPMIDLIRVLAAPTRFDRGHWIDPFFPQRLPYPGFPMYDQPTLADSDSNGDATTAHARERAIATSNPLWVYALARRPADIADLALIRAAVAALPATALADADREALQFDLAAEEIRILLMAGRLDEAIATFSRMRHDPLADWLERDRVTDAGMRYLLAKRDLLAARKWAAATTSHELGYKGRYPITWTFLLAANWQEALSVGSGRNPAETEPSNSEASALDLLPADKLIALSRTPGLAPGWRRPLMSAGWLRLYLLRRDDDFRALFPDVRAAFPELISDLDDIDAAWMPWTQRRLIVRMLLRLPGLSPRVLWARSSRSSYYQHPREITAIDQLNPSDGNWWCAIDPTRAARDTFSQMFARPLSGNIGGAIESFDTFKYIRYDLSDAENAALNAMVEDWIAWHPLLRDADFDELRRLSQVESGPQSLSQVAIGWADHSYWFTRILGMDRNLPETLALAVRSTRFGCRRQGPLGDVSREAWQALHQIYPDSEWAKRTPYWFNEGHN